MNYLIDRYNRKHDYLRISLTDKCNFNCLYCNPKDKSPSESTKQEILSYEEILRTIDLFASKLNFKKFRFTGGEPLVRKDFFHFLDEVNKLKIKYKFKLGLTSNASLLKNKTSLLKEKGIETLNISLDSLKSDKFFMLTGKDQLSNVLTVIDEAIDAGFSPLKVNTVIIKGHNDDEILDFVDFAINKNINLRMIEFMPFGNNDWGKDGFMDFNSIKNIVKQKHSLVPIHSSKNSVAKDFGIEGKNGIVSFISSVSEHFCDTCNRVRLSSDGNFRLCLFTDGDEKLNFKELYRSGLSDEEIINVLQKLMVNKWEKHPSAEELSKIEKNNMVKIGG